MRLQKGTAILLLLPLLIGSGCASGRGTSVIEAKDQEIARLKAELESKKSGEKARADELDRELQEALAKLAKEQKLSLEGNRLVLPNAVLFASGSVKISDSGKKVLDEIWEILKEHPNRDILVEGHTDNVPIAQKFQGNYKSNWELSTARALAVLHYVRAKPGAHPSRLGAAGYGEYRPIADNSTDEGRKKNRRVVIVVMSRN